MNARIFFLIAITMLLLSGILLAQPGGPPPTMPGQPPQIPIDGGLGWLAAAGGAYAWKKLRDKHNEPSDEEI